MTSHVTGKSLSVSTGSIFSERSNSKSDRILEQLKRDSEDISEALAFYLEQRNDISEKRKIAEREYDAEMAEIGDVSDIEEFAEDEDGVRGGVDHNLRRHLNAAGEEGTGDDREADDYYGEDFEDFENEVISFAYTLQSCDCDALLSFKHTVDIEKTWGNECKATGD